MAKRILNDQGTHGNHSRQCHCSGSGPTRCQGHKGAYGMHPVFKQSAQEGDHGQTCCTAPHAEAPVIVIHWCWQLSSEERNA